MKKLLILLLISGAAFGQRLGIIDQDTTKRPPTGLAAMAFNNGVLKVIRPSGSSYKVVTENNTYTNPSWFVSIPASKVSDFTSASQTVGDARYLPITGGTFTGTSGSGFAGFSAQIAAPSTPSTGFRLYANSSNALSWKGANGYTRTFDGTSNTGNWSYTLQNANGTIPLLESAQTWSAVNTFSGLLQSASNIAWSTGGTTGSSGKNLHWAYDSANSIGYIKSINTGTAFTELRVGASALSFWTGSSSVAERAGVTGTGLLYANSGLVIGKSTITSNRLLELSGVSPYVIFSPTTGGGVSSYTIGVDSYGFVLYDDTQSSYRMVVKNNGNVLIGDYVDTGYKLKVNGSALMMGTVNITAGANKAVNTATLSGGTVTVSNTTVTASSIIYVTGQNCSSCGAYYISAKTAGTSFTITSTNASDASTVAFLIIN